jgi:hypothetical protein
MEYTIQPIKMINYINHSTTLPNQKTLFIKDTVQVSNKLSICNPDHTKLADRACLISTIRSSVMYQRKMYKNHGRDHCVKVNYISKYKQIFLL